MTTTATAKQDFDFNAGGRRFDPGDWTNTLRALQ